MELALELFDGEFDVVLFVLFRTLAKLIYWHSCGCLSECSSPLFSSLLFYNLVSSCTGSNLSHKFLRRPILLDAQKAHQLALSLLVEVFVIVLLILKFSDYQLLFLVLDFPLGKAWGLG